MVNIEEFSKRLIIIMDYYEISAAVLAENIEVQRSSISHILSGRNKPSLDFVLKILKACPPLNYIQIYLVHRQAEKWQCLYDQSSLLRI